MMLQNFHTQETEGFCPDIPPSFGSIEEAHDSFQYHTNQSIQIYYEIQGCQIAQSLTQTRMYLEIFHQWHLSLQAFLRITSDSLSLIDKQAARVLQLNVQYLMLCLDIGMQGDRPQELVEKNNVRQFQQLSPLPWDSFTPRFKQITAFARIIVEHSIELDVSQNSHKFSSDENIVMTLYRIASQCRDPIVRREAVTLLYQLPHQGGLWDSIATARVCEKLVSIEEEGLGKVACCEDVPEWARVRHVKVSVDMDGCIGKIGYRRQRSQMDLGSADLEESFQW